LCVSGGNRNGAHLLLSIQNGESDGATGQMDGWTVMEFAQAQAAIAGSARPVGGLSPGEQRVLAAWITAARNGGIETAEDLGVRPWPGHGTETIIGVFKSGHLLASWLVVGHASEWAVASCGDGAVSRRVDSLAAALDLVYPRQPTRH
jgi:hypothetical protein